ncbi:alpha/beta fold hydrolase [Leptospira kemamanensis]|uniref:Alpha/beta fold hydrolase n=1 Tax=Leptospira kemamanensis TaxID=2484942 RepID=A0A4R9JTG4_9LEPT|nr:alpha/beta fold hydrolase [Leptospira kemamanensis]TGL54116.1 alpha/beta fold hydrolase [Leptospira kemamanensis]
MEWKYLTIERDGFSFLVARNHIEGPHLFWLGSALYYPRVIRESLFSRYNITIVDHRGFAKQISPREESENLYHLESILSDFAYFQDYLEIPTCTVLGHSGHGYMALTYAARFPKQVSELVMVATGPSHGAPLAERDVYFERMGSEERKVKHKELQSSFQKQIESYPEGLPNFFQLYCTSQDALGFYDLKTNSIPFWEGVRTNKLAFDYLFGKVFAEIQVEDYLSKVFIPTKLILGQYDFQVAPYYTWDPILAEFPNVKRVVIDQVGHLPFYEDSNQFVQVMDSE